MILPNRQTPGALGQPSRHFPLLCLQERFLVCVSPTLPPDQTSVLRFKKRDGLVRDLNPGPLAPKARIIPLDQRATTSLVLRSPVLLQVTPVKCPVIAQLSACAPVNPALWDRGVSGSRPQSGFRGTFRLSAPRAAGTGGSHTHTHTPLSCSFAQFWPQIEAGDSRSQEDSPRDGGMPRPEPKQALELPNMYLSTELYLSA